MGRACWGSPSDFVRLKEQQRTFGMFWYVFDMGERGEGGRGKREGGGRGKEGGREGGENGGGRGREGEEGGIGIKVEA